MVNNQIYIGTHTKQYVSPGVHTLRPPYGQIVGPNLWYILPRVICALKHSGMSVHVFIALTFRFMSTIS